MSLKINKTNATWFNKNDIKLTNNTPVILNDLHGYVLPHASTKYTGNIISHTLQFKPAMIITYILIIFYPAFDTENIIIGSNKYYHEYYVPWQSILCALDFWNIDINSITFVPINVRLTNKNNNFNHLLQNIKNTLIIVSSDFSHYRPFKEAIQTENTAAHALMYKNTDPQFMDNVVDDPKSYNFLFKILPKDFTLQWIGRTRSLGKKAVGYLSFLIQKQYSVNTKLPDGIFVTCYDVKMRHRECLGIWFTNNTNNTNKYSTIKEKELINKVIKLGETQSRLTGGQFIASPIKYYTVSYLYKSQTNKFIRGWHTVLSNATYLSEVFLENTFNNGEWIDFKNDTKWRHNGSQNETFDMTETIKKLNEKAGTSQYTPIIYYDTKIKNVTITDNKINENKKTVKRTNKNNKTKFKS